jgi:Tfp pilus assembly protein PilV
MMFVKRQESIVKSRNRGEERGARSEIRSTLRTPHSTLPRGLSLTEVLISMGILTLGLLGVASVFPVGSFYMQKAEISDKASAIAQTVMNDIMARGMLNPRSWFVMVPNPPGTTTNSPNTLFSGIDGKYAPSPPVTQPDPTNGFSKTTSTFARPFAEALAEGLKRTTDPVVLAKQFGSAFVIDPMYAAATATTTVNNNNVIAYPFPATAYARYPWPSSTYYGSTGWNPWRASGGVASGERQKTWPIRRVTFQQANGWALDKTMAESLFRGNDDLSVDFPARDDRPGIQTWDTNTSASGSTVPLARKWAGDYSWIVSVVPTTNAARDGMVRNPEGFAYDVSVVVFYKRILPGSLPVSTQDMQDAAAHERMVGAKIISTGMNGGELLLTDMGDVAIDVTKPASASNNKSPFDDLRSGQWIMLCGPHPNSNVTMSSGAYVSGDIRFVLNWYQVISIEKEGTTSYGAIDPTTQRLVTVRGVEWPWQPAANLTDYTQLSNDLCVGIFRGAVAVHTKTIRLESPSAIGTAALKIPNNVTPPPYDESR